MLNRRLLNSLKGKYIYVDLNTLLSNPVSCSEPQDFLKNKPMKSILRLLKRTKAKQIILFSSVTNIDEYDNNLYWVEKYCRDVKLSARYWFVSMEDWPNFLESYGENKKAWEIWGDIDRLHCGSLDGIFYLIFYDRTRPKKDSVIISDNPSVLNYAMLDRVLAYQSKYFTKV